MALASNSIGTLLNIHYYCYFTLASFWYIWHRHFLNISILIITIIFFFSHMSQSQLEFFRLLDEKIAQVCLHFHQLVNIIGQFYFLTVKNVKYTDVLEWLKYSLKLNFHLVVYFLFIFCQGKDYDPSEVVSQCCPLVTTKNLAACSQPSYNMKNCFIFASNISYQTSVKWCVPLPWCFSVHLKIFG